MSDRADPAVVPLADRHYNRQKVGAPQFAPPGRCLVLRTVEGTLRPWVSMAEALGWPTGVTVQHRRGGERLEEEWSADRPSDTVTTRVNRWQLNTGRHWKKGGDRDDAQSVDLDQPAPTITGADTQLQWRRTDLVGFPRLADGTPELASEPAFTLTEKARSWQRWPTDPLELKGGDWPTRRPATTIAGDPRVFQPGGHHEEGEQSKNAIVVTVEEAAVLQSFRPDYPWQGARTRQFEQVGNAVPPLLAQHVLEALLHV